MTDPTTPTLTSTLPPSISARLREILSGMDERGLTVAMAESCTGGLISAALSGVQGLSHVFVCGFVTYSDGAKRTALGVSARTLETEGAVSRRCAIEMAEGALKRSSADVAVSVTGFAGPGGPDDEEGLVWFGLSRQGRPTLTQEAHFGAIGRDAVRLSCLNRALDLLSKELESQARHPARRVAA